MDTLHCGQWTARHLTRTRTHLIVLYSSRDFSVDRIKYNVPEFRHFWPQMDSYQAASTDQDDLLKSFRPGHIKNHNSCLAYKYIGLHDGAIFIHVNLAAAKVSSRENSVTLLAWVSSNHKNCKSCPTPATSHKLSLMLVWPGPGRFLAL